MGIVREEMDKIGQEFFLPALNPREVWEGPAGVVGHGRQYVFASKTVKAQTSVWA